MRQGSVETYAKGQVFYALDFTAELYIVTAGYVKRYQVAEDGKRVIESIYGPSYFFPLTQVYKKLLQFDLSQEDVTYVYEGMTDIEILGISSEQLEEAVTQDPSLYKDLLYEAGRRLKANINRLASNALHDDYKKVAHQLVYLADEFGKTTKDGVQIGVPLTPLDMAEQLNISAEVAEAVMANLEAHDLIATKTEHITVPSIPLLKDAYLIGSSVKSSF